MASTSRWERARRERVSGFRNRGKKRRDSDQAQAGEIAVLRCSQVEAVFFRGTSS